MRSLHARGSTGAGIGVAIIDGQVRLDHVEYADRLVHYEEFGDFSGLPFAMHGPSTACLLVSRSVVVAPGAALPYIALDFAPLTPGRLAVAIDHVVAQSQSAARRARALVSVSTGYRGQECPVVDDAIRRAIDNDVFVLVSVYPLEFLDAPVAIRGLGCPLWRDGDRPEAFGVSPGEAAYWRSEDESVGDVLARRAASDAQRGT